MAISGASAAWPCQPMRSALCAISTKLLIKRERENVSRAETSVNEKDREIEREMGREEDNKGDKNEKSKKYRIIGAGTR